MSEWNEAIEAAAKQALKGDIRRLGEGAVRIRIAEEIRALAAPAAAEPLCESVREGRNCTLQAGHEGDCESGKWRWDSLKPMALAEPRSDDWPECEDFYDLMQAYRHAPVTNQQYVSTCYGRVKNWLRANPRVALAEPVPQSEPRDRWLGTCALDEREHCGNHYHRPDCIRWLGGILGICDKAEHEGAHILNVKCSAWRPMNSFAAAPSPAETSQASAGPVTAMRQLINECRAMLAFEMEMREISVCGNTNVNVFKLRVQEAEASLIRYGLGEGKCGGTEPGGKA